MIYIYKITNKINNKVYIGSTIHPDRRQYEHFYYAHSVGSNSYNYPLQCAIRKYGNEAFLFEIIDEVDDLNAPQKELSYIRQYNSLAGEGWGYNQTLYTECSLRDPEVIQQNREKNGTKCALVDTNNNIIEYFLSYGEAAKSIGLNNSSSLIKNICEGKLHSNNGQIFRHLDNDKQIIVPLKSTRKRKKMICGILLSDPNDIVIYDSITEAAKIEHIDRSSISKCIAENIRYGQVGGRKWYYTEDENYEDIIKNKPKLNTNFYKMIEINGVYKSMKNWCLFYNITPQAVYKRMKKSGISVVEALMTQKKGGVNTK